MDEMTIGELAAAAAAAVADVHGANRRVTEVPDARTIRWYATIGLLDRPSGNRGRTALYGERHLLQVVAIKRRQAQGRSLAEIQDELVGATDRTLRRIAAVPPQSCPPPDVPGHVSGRTTRKGGNATRREFWREPPAAPPRSPVLSGVDLGDGVVLMLPAQPGAEDIDAITAAARPLLDLLATRRLTRGRTR